MTPPRNGQDPQRPRPLRPNGNPTPRTRPKRTQTLKSKTPRPRTPPHATSVLTRASASRTDERARPQGPPHTNPASHIHPTQAQHAYVNPRLFARNLVGRGAFPTTFIQYPAVDEIVTSRSCADRFPAVSPAARPAAPPASGPAAAIRRPAGRPAARPAVRPAGHPVARPAVHPAVVPAADFFACRAPLPPRAPSASSSRYPIDLPRTSPPI